MKFELEKVLHEIMRDVPEAAAIDRKFKNGFLTNDDAFQTIAEIIRAEKEKAAFANIPIIDTATGETVSTNAHQETPKTA